MKGFSSRSFLFLFTVAVVTKQSRAAPLSWNLLLGAEETPIFPSFLNSPHFLGNSHFGNLTTREKSLVLGSLQEILHEPKILSKIYSNYLTIFEKEKDRQFGHIFVENLTKIARQNLDFHSGLSSWEEGVNKFTDMPQDEIEEYRCHDDSNSTEELNSWIEHDKSLDLEFNLDSKSQSESSLDWRERGIVTPVKDQKNCGSCWAFGAIALLESAVAKSGGGKQGLAEQELVDCDRSNNGCNGGNWGGAINYLKKNGVTSQDQYPYRARGGQCQKKQAVARVKNSGTARSESQMRDACAQYGPIGVAFLFHDDMARVRSGVYDGACGDRNSGHAVAVVGYGSENGKDYWIIKNSYGSGWGDRGYFKIVRGKNKCDIGSRAGGNWVTA